MNIVERYLGRVLVSHSLLVLFVLLLILGFSELMMQLTRMSDSYTLGKIVIFTLLKLPVYGYDIFPIALLIGALMGLGGLANNGELTVLRVTGWSIMRIFWGVLKSVFLFWLVFALMGETLAPKAENYAQKLRAEALNQNVTIGSRADFWMKDESRFIHVARVISERQFQGVEIFLLNEGEIVKKLSAQSATYEGKNGEGAWVLQGVKTVSLDWLASDFVTERVPSLKWLDVSEAVSKSQEVTFPVTPTMLQGLQIETRYMNLVDLVRYIGFLDDNGLDAESYNLAFWRKVVSPFALVAMIALVFPLIFGSQRQVSMGQRIFVGIVVGLGFHLLNQMIGNLTVVYHFASYLGATAPSLLLMAISGWLFTRLR